MPPRKWAIDAPVDVTIGNAAASPAAGCDESLQLPSVAAFAKLSHDNFLLRETLNNITFGVVMLDARARIVLCNDRYLEMYGLSSDIVKPGCTFLNLIKHRKAAGYFSGNVKKYCKETLDTIKRGNTSSQHILTTDGRTIHIVNQPMAGGGWVVTHEDVSKERQAEAK
jgi:PAS domain-containing protein